MECLLLNDRDEQQARDGVQSQQERLVQCCDGCCEQMVACCA